MALKTRQQFNGDNAKRWEDKRRTATTDRPTAYRPECEVTVTTVFMKHLKKKKKIS